MLAHQYELPLLVGEYFLQESEMLCISDQSRESSATRAQGAEAKPEIAIGQHDAQTTRTTFHLRVTRILDLEPTSAMTALIRTGLPIRDDAFKVVLADRSKQRATVADNIIDIQNARLDPRHNRFEAPFASNRATEYRTLRSTATPCETADR
jgi:hypothetical protein